jgi:hypothetical protein
MSRSIKNIDVNELPVHLFVKSQKEAKKLNKQRYTEYTEVNLKEKSRRFWPVFVN